jgi:succinate-semialdehyde dehydrogenase / glutarate-semialdehyde dehydrogenase
MLFYGNNEKIVPCVTLVKNIDFSTPDAQLSSHFGPNFSMKINPLSTLNSTTLLQTNALLDGQWVSGSKRFDVIDPATARKLADVANLDAQHATQAIQAAQNALAAWQGKTAKERGQVLMNWFNLVLKNKDDLARIITAEQGKPLFEAQGEVLYGASFIEWFAEEGKRAYGETVPSPDGKKRYVVIKQAVGVCAAITPWNFPLAMITRKVAPALAAGCTVVLKPAEQTPLSALALAQLALQAGLPPGVLNVITGTNAAEIGQVLCASTVVRHVSFTGSTEVGRILAAQCAPGIKKLSLELGGNAPFIVFDDADLDAAIDGAMASKFRNAGQTCVCTNRFYVQSAVFDAFNEKLVQRVKLLRTGNGFDQTNTVGPLIDAPAIEKVQRHVQDALVQGAKLLVGGHPINTHFFEPTVLSNVTASMLCAQEETFGPVASVFKFDTEDEAVAQANATEFGLAAYFYSRDVGRVFRVAEALEVGMVGVNTGMLSTAEAPFGGVKQSGLGREGSRHGLDDYLQIKLICLGGL